MTQRQGLIWICFVCFFLIITGNPIEAQDFPTDTIKIICGYAPGGSADVQIRLLAPFLQKHLRKSVMVENLTGANAMLATNKVFTSPPDGYTLLVASIPVLILQEKYLPEAARYQTRTLTHIYSFVRDDFVLASHPEVWNNFAEFSKAAQNKHLRVGIAGKGTPSHLYALMIEEMANVKFNIIPFEGGGPAMTSLAGKHVDGITTVLSSSYHLIKSGTLNPILILSDKRHSALTQTPTPKDIGFKSFEPIFYITGIFGPPKLPANRINILGEAVSKAIKEPEFLEKAKAMILEVYPLDSKDFLANTEKQYSQVEQYIDLLKGRN
jgi:tripartite-type tricarboxylate transporter receptor subunit TctC